LKSLNLENNNQLHFFIIKFIIKYYNYLINEHY